MPLGQPPGAVPPALQPAGGGSAPPGYCFVPPYWFPAPRPHSASLWSCVALTAWDTLPAFHQPSTWEVTLAEGQPPESRPVTCGLPHRTLWYTGHCAGCGPGLHQALAGGMGPAGAPGPHQVPAFSCRVPRQPGREVLSIGACGVEQHWTERVPASICPLVISGLLPVAFPLGAGVGNRIDEVPTLCPCFIGVLPQGPQEWRQWS